MANAWNVVSRARSKKAQQLQRPGYLKHFFAVLGNIVAADLNFLWFYVALPYALVYKEINF
jgi:hypothetical protein